MIAESCEEGILSDVLKEFATCMSRKGGVQVLDISNTLSQVMTESQFHVVDIDEDFHMKKLSDYLSHNLGEAQYYGDDDAMSNSGGNAGEGEKGDSENVKGKKKKKGEKNKDWGGNKGDIKAKDRNKDDDSKLTADEEGDVDDDKNDLPGDQEKLDKDKDGDIDAKDLKKLRKEGVEATAEETEEEAPAEPTEEEEDAEAEEVENDQIEDQANNSEWRDLVASLEDVTKKIDLNFDEESIEDEEEDAEAGEGEEPTPPQDSPA